MIKDNNQRTVIWFLLILTIVISLSPFFSVGFTTADDLANYMSYIRKSVFKESWLYAIGAGRFYFLITKPLYSLPYLGDNFIVTKTIQNLSLLLSYFLFARLIVKIFKSKELAYTLFLLLVMATPISANYFLPFIAYPFYFSFSFSIVIISVLLFVKYTETKKYKFVMFSTICFFVAIVFYETYIVFLLFFVFCILWRNVVKTKRVIKLLKSKSFYQEIAPFVLAGFVYVSIYFVFRMAFKSTGELYAGSSFAKNFSFANYFTILFGLTKTILPSNIYNLSQDLISQNSLLPSGHINNFWYVLANSSLSSIINATIQIFLFVYLSLRFEKTITYKKIVFGIVISILLAILSHSVLGIAQKYNSVEYSHIEGYVTSFYSYFFVWLFILLIAYALIKLFYNCKPIKIALVALMALGVGYVSIITSYTNDHLSRGWKQSQIRFLAIDELLKKGVFSDIESGSIIYSPEMYNSDCLGDALSTQYFNWGQYIKIRTNKNLHFAKTPEKLIDLVHENQDAKVYRFVKIHTTKNPDFMFVLAEVNKSTIDYDLGKDMYINATCNRGSVHYYSATKDYTFMFYPKSVSSDKRLKIDNWDIISLNEGFNQINVNNSNKNEIISSFEFESDAEIYTEKFSISNMIPYFVKTVNIVNNREVLFSYSSIIESNISIDSTIKYPKSLLPEIDINSSYSIISLSALLEISLMQKDRGIHLVVEVRNAKNEVIYWESEKFTNINEISYTKLIDLDVKRESNPSKLKFYIWNPEACSFTIKKNSNASIKAI